MVGVPWRCVFVPWKVSISQKERADDLGYSSLLEYLVVCLSTLGRDLKGCTGKQVSLSCKEERSHEQELEHVGE